MWVNHIDSYSYRPHHRVLCPPGGAEEHEREAARKPPAQQRNRRNMGNLSNDFCPQVIQEEEKIKVHKESYLRRHFLKESDPSCMPLCLGLGPRKRYFKRSESRLIVDSAFEDHKKCDEDQKEKMETEVTLKKGTVSENIHEAVKTESLQQIEPPKRQIDPLNMLIEEHLSGFIPSSVYQDCLVAVNKCKDQLNTLPCKAKNFQTDSIEKFCKPLISPIPTDSTTDIHFKVDRKKSENLFKQASSSLYKVAGKQEVVNPITGAIQVFDVYRAIK